MKMDFDDDLHTLNKFNIGLSQLRVVKQFSLYYPGIHLDSIKVHHINIWWISTDHGFS